MEETIKEGKIYKLRVEDGKAFLDYERDNFSLPDKLYGDVVFYSELIKYYYHDKYSRSGVLLIGESGTGKTLQAQHICNYMLSLGYDVMYIYGIQDSKTVIKFLNETTFQGVVFIDEYGKMFSNNEMDRLLSVIGDDSYHRLFVVTESEDWRIPKDMSHRPGRFLFKKIFGRVTMEMISECCRDKGVSEAFKEELLERNRFCTKFNLDMLNTVTDIHINYPDLPLDTITEYFSLDGLRMYLEITKCSLIYKGIDMCSVYRSKDVKYAYVGYMHDDPYEALTVKMINQFIRRDKKFVVTLYGTSFTEEDYEAIKERKEGFELPDVDTAMSMSSFKLPKKELEVLKECQNKAGNFTLNGLRTPIRHDVENSKLYIDVTEDMYFEFCYDTNGSNKYASRGRKNRLDPQL